MLDFPNAPVAGDRYVGTNGVTYTWQAPQGLWSSTAVPAVLPPGYSSVRDFGAKGDGVTDDTAAIQAAITASATGVIGTLYFPQGTYLVSAPIGRVLSGDLEIVMATDAIIKATAAFPAGTKMWQFLAPDTPSLNLRLKISGGKFDGSLRPAVLPGTAADILNIGGSGFVQCIIDGVFFYSNADRTGTAGDAGVFFASGRNLTISNCIFQGTTDVAIYLSGDTTQSFGENATFYNNTYLECAGAINSKRQWKRMLVWGEDIQGTGTAISTAEADTAPTKLPGLDITVAWCNIRSCQRGINVRWADGAKVMHNKITDYGLLYATGAPVVDAGILLEGSSNCLVDGNTCTISGYTTISVQAGIKLAPRTIDVTTRHSTNNLVVNNQVIGCDRGIYETDVNQDFNRYLGNVIVGAAVNGSYVINGASSTTDRGLENNRRELNYPTVSLGGILGAESLRVNRVANAVNFFAASGAVTSGTPTFQVTGTDTDINMTISPRGLGAIIFGPIGSESMRVNRVASQVNRLHVQGAIATASPSISVAGTDTNIGILLTPKGTGTVTITLANVGNFTSDALAAAGGVPIGGIYRNASALQIRTV